MSSEPKLGVNRGNAGKGRPRGSLNKATALLKDAILQAATDAHNDGLVGYLTDQAKDNPGPFLALLGKVLPLQLAGTVDHTHTEVQQRANKFTEAMQSLIERAETRTRPN